MSLSIKSPNSHHLNRRSIFKAVSGLGLGGLLGTYPGAQAQTQAVKGRLAIIGGGMGGISAAYFCDPQWKVELFESRSKLGGHCDTVTVNYKGRDEAIDLGAQFCHPKTHPLYVSLLSQIGLYQDEDAAADVLVDAEGSLSVFDADSLERLFVSKEPLKDPLMAINFAAYTQAARKMVAGNGSWFITLEEWVDGLFLSDKFKYELLLPWLSSLIGTTYEEAKRCSARSILQTFALSFPANILKGAKTYNAAIGLGGNLEYLASLCQQTKFHRDAAIVAIEKVDATWFLETADTRHGPFDAVVFNLPPHTGKQLLRTFPWAEGLVQLLDRFQYFRTDIAVHEDPCYMLPARKSWAVYNAAIGQDACEGSVWVGALHGKTEGAQALDIFKSWATYRSFKPKKIIASRTFRHPLLTPDTLAAARDINQWQGRQGIYFSGQYTTGTDLQESALYSGLKVSSMLSPESHTLQAFQARLQREGKSHLRYEPFN